jgi:integrase
MPHASTPPGIIVSHCSQYFYKGGKLMTKAAKKPRETKSAKGEAMIHARSDTWIDKNGKPQHYQGCSWTAVMTDGSKKRIVLCAKTKELLAAKKKAKEAELARGEYVCRNGITFGVWVCQWLEEYKKISLSPTTYRSYEVSMNAYIVPKLGRIPLQKVTNSDIQRLINGLKQCHPKEGEKPKKLSTSATKQVYSIVRQCFAQAVLNRIVSFSPCVGIKLPKDKPRQRHAFTDDELRRLMNATKVSKKSYRNPSMVPVLLMLIETGCRRGEALGLKWDNVDVEDNTVFIKDTIVEIDGKLREKDNPKNSSSIRRIPISQELMDILKALDRNGDYVFHTKRGTPITPSSFNRRFEQWCYDAGLWDGKQTKKGWAYDQNTGHATHTPHDLRHTFITDMVNNGVSIVNIQMLTGHSTTRALMGYAHAIPETALSAMRERRSRLDTTFDTMAPSQD